ncbi:MAG: GrpB family protein [Holosporaceae bacterium]|nr:GrpB family protein [Holosporaceae bacterium]
MSPYDSDWPKIFETEKEIILAALEDNLVAIHYIGSTAVPGLAAKPKIDIIAAFFEHHKRMDESSRLQKCLSGLWEMKVDCLANQKDLITIL